MMSQPLFDFLQRLQSRRYPVSASGNSFFYIYDELRELATETIIADLISNACPEYEIENHARIIRESGVRLFCILAIMNKLEQIMNFLAHTTLDDRLPIRNVKELQEISPDLDHLFLTKYQWEFFPWVFQNNCGHLILPESTILPFILDEPITSGSGGMVSLVTIPAQQHNLSEDRQKIKVVRKRIKTLGDPGGTMAIFNSERDCLELYRRLSHPNIIRLLSSFTLDGHHNFLFPKYARNLDDFFNEDKSGKFRFNDTFTSAVADLASALQTVHEASWRSRVKPNFYTRYGYHHDFRPSNILVTDSTFILADFGLAKFGSEPPIMEWDGNVGHYIAPECMDESFEIQKVGLSYDVWAFGCFLSEIASYMAKGPSGIETFASKRKTRTYYDERYTNAYFFDGKLEALKPGVDDWLHELSVPTQDHTVVSFISLSKKMLRFHPKDRLPMSAQSIRLYFIHVKCLFRLAVDSLERTRSKVKPLSFRASIRACTELEIDLNKLKAFGERLKVCDDTQVDCEYFKDTPLVNLVKGCLSRIHTNHRFSEADLVKYTREWASIESQSDFPVELQRSKILDESIRKDIEILHKALPDQVYSDHLFHNLVISNAPSEETLRTLEDCGRDEPDLYADVGLQAKLQRLERALQNENNSSGIGEENLILDWSQMSDDISTFSKYHNVGVYTCNDVDNLENKSKVLIEWVLISQIPKGEPEEARIEKLLHLARLLHVSKPPGFCSLDCLGFLPPKPDSSYQSGYGFVYPLPPGEKTIEAVNPRTLRSLLDDRKFPITLGEKFNIATRLATSMFQLHSHNWLHKNVRSDNIVFCGYEDKYDEKQRVKYEITSGPYVIGFHHGRPDGDIFYSDVPSSGMNEETLLYQHPRYKPGSSRFRKAYDSYGLAIILIELAYWTPAKDLRSKRQESNSLLNEPLWDVFDKRYSRSLTETMGNAYMEATRACLEEIDETSDPSASDITVGVSKFYDNVVGKLKRCYV
ncbi:kinase-like domain-containing protein, partial [Annulohypoxylon bovei var. microspora]